MNCLDCTRVGIERAAVAVCGRCGAAICPDHLVESEHRLTVRVPINVRVAIEPPACERRCGICARAEDAAARNGDHSRRVSAAGGRRLLPSPRPQPASS